MEQSYLVPENQKYLTDPDLDYSIFYHSSLEYKERYHRFFNEHIAEFDFKHSSLIYDKKQNTVTHPRQSECDIVILSYNKSINEHRENDIFQYVCFNKGRIVNNRYISTEGLNFYGFEFSLVQINNHSRLFYAPNLDNKEDRLNVDLIRQIILEDIQKAADKSFNIYQNEIKETKRIKAFYDQLKP